MAAAQVARAAQLAADALTQATTPGNEREAARTATVLADTVEATAQATAQDTARAAATVASDVEAAAARVRELVAAEKDALQDKVFETADALRVVNDVAAEQMAAETQARAAGVALTAREAAAALPASATRSIPGDTDLPVAMTQR